MAGSLVISTLNNDTGVLATQNGMTGIAKAWVQYNGTAQTIYSSFNCSSITYNGTGDYTFNFTTAMPSTSYIPVVSSNSDPAAGPQFIATNFSTVSNNTVAPTTTAMRFSCWVAGSGAGRNNTYLNVAVLGN